MDVEKTALQKRIAELAPLLVEVSHEIHANPELGYEEHKAAALLARVMEEHGLEVQRGVADLETAFTASAGVGSPHIALCAEYDALPGIGHACGHNIIAAAALGAGIALSERASALGFRVSIVGTPAEEGGAGKAVLAEAGIFDGVDAAMMVHPAPIDITEPPMLAVAQYRITYRGRTSHASAAPELGINALDAMHIAYTAISCLRQQTAPTDRIHGVINRGGDVPNVIPEKTRATYYVRSKTASELKTLAKRVEACFEAGAIATGCELEIDSDPNVYHEVIHNMAIANAFRANLEALGRVPLPRNLVDPKHAGSTDMGNLSYLVPSIHPMIGINSLPAVNHQPEFAQHCVSEAGDKAVVDGATALAWTTLDLALDTSLMNAAADEFAKVIGAKATRV
ncbi:MAG: amidohydrolase [Acidobacteria bacterium]|nr:MAG: amidohydrolase [Acidobacteriota bacterium]